MNMPFFFLISFAFLCTACGGQGDVAENPGQALNPTVEFLDDNGDHLADYAITATYCIDDAIAKALNNESSSPKEITEKCSWVCDLQEKFHVKVFAQWLLELVRKGELSKDGMEIILRFTIEYCPLVSEDESQPPTD